tara:strand:- start:1247 stop:1930 length:684 start_codon:yes stop_codon:yes gene_type:complete
MIYDYKITPENAMLKLSFSDRLRLKELSYGSPSGGEEAYTTGKVSIKGWEECELRPPPPNDSDTTYQELLQLKAIMTASPENFVSRAREQDKKEPSFEFAFVDYIRDEENDDIYGLVDRLGDELTRIGMHHKLYYQRPRPYQVADVYGMDLEIPIGQTTKTPSYPSNHSFIGKCIALHLAKLYPTHSDKLNEMGDEFGLNRVRMGWHFPTDHHAGQELAYKISPLIK